MRRREMEIQERALSFELCLEISKRSVAVKQPSSKVKILETRWRSPEIQGKHTWAL